MSGFCPHADQLAALVNRPPGDPFWAHAEGCPHCRARLHAYRRFLAPEEGGEDLDFDLEPADSELEARLTAALGLPAGGRGRLLRWRSPRAFYALAALLLVGVGLTVAPELTRPRLSRPPVSGEALRGDEQADGGHLISAAGDGWRLAWPVRPEADQVLAVFFDDALNEVGLTAAAASAGGVTVTRTEAGPGAAFVQIVYLALGDTLARGPLLRTPLPGR